MLSIPHLSRSDYVRYRRLRRCYSNNSDDDAVHHLLLERDAVRLLPPAPPVALTLALLPNSTQLAIVERHPPTDHTLSITARARRVRRTTRNCRTLRRVSTSAAGARHPISTISPREHALTQELAAMQRNIAHLEQTRTLLHSIQLVRHANAAGLVADKVAAYYRYFQRGYDPIRANSATLEALLRSIMLDDVESPAFGSIDMFLLQWTHYSQYHAGITLDVTAIHPVLHGPTTTTTTTTTTASNDDDDADADSSLRYIIQVTGVATMRISRATIVHFFQPLRHDETLVQSLIGQTYAVAFTTTFYFNDAGRVCKFEPFADVATGLLTLVRDPQATATLLDASKLTTDGCLHAYGEDESQCVVASHEEAM